MTTAHRAVAGIILLSYACAGGSETGNPAVPLGLTAWSSDPTQVAIGGGAGVVVDEVWVSLGGVGFLVGQQCDEDAADDFETDAVIVDLVAPQTQITIDATAATYCGVSLPITADNTRLPAGAPASLRDHSLVIGGERADGTPFVIELAEDDELELRGPFTIAPTDVGHLLLALDVALLLADVDLAAALVSTDGVVHVDETRNAELLGELADSFECALQLYRDDNRNGVRDTTDMSIAACEISDEP